MSNDHFIAVVCGLKSEAAVMRAAVANDVSIRIGVSGANAARAEEIARQFCNHGASAIVSVGVSGGLDPALKPGDLIIGNEIIADDGAVFEPDKYLLDALFSSPIYGGGVAGGDGEGHGADGSHPLRSCGPPPPQVREEEEVGKPIVGSLFGADEIVKDTGKKAMLFQNHGALAVDMESHGAARAAAQAGVPFLAIRAIADPADRALPPAAFNAVAPDGSTRVFATLAAAMRDPKQFPLLMKLGADSSAALKTLRRDLGPFFGRLFLSLDL